MTDAIPKAARELLLRAAIDLHLANENAMHEHGVYGVYGKLPYDEKHLVMQICLYLDIASPQTQTSDWEPTI
jgi:hypothetical protein